MNTKTYYFNYLSLKITVHERSLNVKIVLKTKKKQQDSLSHEIINIKLEYLCSFFL